MCDGPIHLFLDWYSVHHTEAMKQAAARLGITLHFIPSGLTDEIHPLDRVVLDMLKAQIEHLFRARFHLNPGERRTKQHSMANMITACSLL
jgi:hypothetical protein